MTGKFESFFTKEEKLQINKEVDERVNKLIKEFINKKELNEKL